MAKYRFRLATLQRVQHARRDRERAALAEAFHAQDVLAERRKQLEVEQVDLRDLQRSAAADRILNVNQLLEAQRYELVLRAREAELNRQSAALAIETERRRHVLVEADRDVRVLELLEERQRREHQLCQRRVEAKQLDEAAVQRYGAIGAHPSW
jgi:flagellar FliJ protein